MTGQDPPQERAGYGGRFWVNLALTVTLAVAAWMWFNVHVKPHMSGRLFGGVTIAAGVAIALGVVKLFIGDAATNTARESMHSPRLTAKLLMMLPVVAAAYLTTSTIYFVAGKKPADERPLVLRVRNGSAVEEVSLTSSRTEAAMTFPFRLRPVSLQIATDGHRDKEVSFRYFHEEPVPDPALVKSIHLLRVAPGKNLFRMHGRRNDYRLRVLRNGQPFYDQPFRSFETLYLGAPESEADARHGDPEHLRQMREYMRAVDPAMPEAAVQTWIDRWVDAKNTAATPELSDGDEVQVMLLAEAGAKIFERSIRIEPGKRVHTVFLEQEPTP